MGLAEGQKKGPPPPAQGSGIEAQTCGRESAIGALKSLIARKQAETDNLDELYRCLSANEPLNQLADEALWKLIVGFNR